MASSSWTIQPLTSERLHEARELFVDIFTSEEPMSVALGLSRDDTYKTYPMENMQSCLKYPLSVVAVTASNEVIGVGLVDGEFPSCIEGQGPPIMKPLNAICDSLVSCIDMREFQSNKVAYGIAGAVKKQRRGEGIAKALGMENVRLAKRNGYKYYISFSSSTYSLNISLKLGFQVKAFKKYQEFEYNGQKPFMNINPEHEGVRLVVLSLDHFLHSKL